MIRAMLDMSVIGWIVVGGLAGWISAALIGARTARGCLPNLVIGVVGGLIGGWVATALGFSTAQGFIAAVIVAVFGSLIVRLFLNAMSER
jgi:uncharacterized membrane protein YeaQ/YmgE (transglycosylase-associated protein family)